MQRVRTKQKDIQQNSKLVRDFAALLRSYNGDLEGAKDLYSRASSVNPLTPTRRQFLSNLSLLMFGRCGAVHESRTIFDSTIPTRDDFTWNAMLKVYIDNRRWEDADRIFRQIPQQAANLILCTAMMSVYSTMGRAADAENAFNKIPESELDTTAWTSLLACYSRNGCIDRTAECFNRMPSRDVVSWNALLAAYIANGFTGESIRVLRWMPMWDSVARTTSIRVLEDPKRQFDEMLGGRTIVSFNSLLQAYAQAGHTDVAVYVFERMPRWSVVSWTTMLTAHAGEGDVESARGVFDDMAEGKDDVAWKALLQAYARNGHLERSRELFSRMPVYDVSASVSMCGAYSRHGFVKQATEVYECTPERNAVLWSLVVNAYVNDEDWSQAERMFDLMPFWDVSSCTCVMASFTGSSNFQKAREVFVGSLERDVALWTAFLSCFASSGMVPEAEAVLERMPMTNVLTTNTMLACYVNSSSSNERVREAFERLPRNSSTWALNLAAHAGDPVQVQSILVKAPAWDVAMLNPVAAGYAQSGRVDAALECLQLMSLQGLQPTAFTFVGLLNGFSHGAKVEDGRACFFSMVSDYDTDAAFMHFSCIADMLGRAGHLVEAEELVNTMPYEPDVAAWKSLLDACRSHTDLKRAERAGVAGLRLNPTSPSTHVLLANTYSLG